MEFKGVSEDALCSYRKCCNCTHFVLRVLALTRARVHSILALASHVCTSGIALAFLWLIDIYLLASFVFLGVSVDDQESLAILSTEFQDRHHHVCIRIELLLALNSH